MKKQGKVDSSWDSFRNPFFLSRYKITTKARVYQSQPFIRAAYQFRAQCPHNQDIGDDDNGTLQPLTHNQTTLGLDCQTSLVLYYRLSPLHI